MRLRRAAELIADFKVSGIHASFWPEYLER
jgi:hypothetical protein